MIRLTRLDGREFVLNAEMIEKFEATPETVIFLAADKYFVVKESIDEVFSRIIDYKHMIFSNLKINTTKTRETEPPSPSQFNYIECEDPQNEDESA